MTGNPATPAKPAATHGRKPDTGNQGPATAAEPPFGLGRLFDAGQGPRDGRNGSKASVSSAGPATARTHAAARRAGDRCLSHAPAGLPSTLTP
jgi:hypothetical protein